MLGLKLNHVSKRGHRCQTYAKSRADSRFAPNQWETSLQSNAISHWLCTISHNLTDDDSVLWCIHASPTLLCHIITSLWCIYNQPDAVGQGWGSLSQFPPLRYFPNFSALSKHAFAIDYHIYIWQVSLQLSCSGTCQIWMWFKESRRHFRKMENFAYGEINEWSFSNPHPWFIRPNMQQPCANEITTLCTFQQNTHPEAPFTNMD